MIPDAAVEAAARAAFERWHPGRSWEASPELQEIFKREAILHLEAAAPLMLSHEREETRLAHLDAVVNAETVSKYESAIDAVNTLLDEKYKLWAAICGNTCSKDIVGVDHDAIADEVAAAVRAAIADALK